MNPVFLKASVLTILFALAAPASAEKTFKDFSAIKDMERTTLASAQGDRLDIIRYPATDRRPVVVIIPGSLCGPLFAALDNSPGQAFATVPVFSEAERKLMDAHVVYLERRNIVSLETMSSAPEFSIEQIFKLSPCSEKNGALTLEQRVADTLTQISWLRQQEWAESVHLVGVSEGSDVAAGVAASDASAVNSLMLIGGAGPSQFADFATFARSKDDAQGISAVFSELNQFLIRSEPASYKGYDSRRWQSFAVDNSVLDNLLKSSVPVFIAHGDKDENVPIFSADLVAVELMRKQPERAIFYRSVAGGDHMLATPEGKQLGTTVVQFVSWATSSPQGRTFKGG